MTQSDDPLDVEIAALEAAMSQDNVDIAELEVLLAQKRQNLQTLSVEIRALKRAASLRPAAAASNDRPAATPAQTMFAVPAPTAMPTPTVVPTSVVATPTAMPAPAPTPAAPQPTRLRSVFGQIRTSDPRLAALPGG